MEIKDANWSVVHSAANPWPEFPKEKSEIEEKKEAPIYEKILEKEKT